MTEPSTLELLPGTYVVAKMDPAADLPGWAQAGGFFSIARSSEELSIVCLEANVPNGIQAQSGFRCLKVQGPLAFEQVGILASLAVPLAQAAIPVFVISTFNTDYLMLQVEDLEAGVDALSRAGHVVRR